MHTALARASEIWKKIALLQLHNDSTESAIDQLTSPASACFVSKIPCSLLLKIVILVYISDHGWSIKTVA